MDLKVTILFLALTLCLVTPILTQVAKVGDQCSTDTECSTITNAHCDAQKCSCKSGYTPATSAGRVCTSIIGLKCQADSECIKLDPNSACTNSINQLKTCQCKSGFSGAVGQTCTANSAAGKSALSILCVTLFLLSFKLLP